MCLTGPATVFLRLSKYNWDSLKLKLECWKFPVGAKFEKFSKRSKFLINLNGIQQNETAKKIIHQKQLQKLLKDPKSIWRVERIMFSIPFAKKIIIQNFSGPREKLIWQCGKIAHPPPNCFPQKNKLRNQFACFHVVDMNTVSGYDDVCSHIQWQCYDQTVVTEMVGKRRKKGTYRKAEKKRNLWIWKFFLFFVLYKKMIWWLPFGKLFWLGE